MSDIKLFDPLVSDITKFVAPAKAVAVTCAISQTKAVEAGKQIKALQKKVEEKRKELVGPLNDQVKTINEYVKTIMAPLAEAEVHLKKEIVKFETEQQRIRQAEQERIERERKEQEAAKQRALAEATAGVTDETECLAIRAKVAAEFKGASKALDAEAKEVKASAMKGAKQVWKFEVTDANLVPKTYLIVDEKAIREAVRAGVREIPGVKIYQETEVAFANTTAVSSAAQRAAYFGGGK